MWLVRNIGAPHFIRPERLRDVVRAGSAFLVIPHPAKSPRACDSNLRLGYHPPHQIPLPDGSLFHQEKRRKSTTKKCVRWDPCLVGGWLWMPFHIMSMQLNLDWVLPS